jgi:hypothetical protein
VNTQMVCAQLMDLVDRPNQVEGIETRRIPIIVTGNDFEKLYAPLVRAGRMMGFEWIPTQEEKIRMIHNLFPDLKMTEIDELFTHLANTFEALESDKKQIPIAFFSHLQSMIHDNNLWRLTQEYGSQKVIEYLAAGKPIQLEKKYKMEEVQNLAVELLKSGKLVNHLKL